MATVIISGIDRTIAVGAATADGGNSGPSDITSGGTYTGDNRSIYTIEIESVDAIGAATANAGNIGVDDCSSSGSYDYTQNSIYTVEIDGQDISEATADSGNTGTDDMTTGGTYAGSTVGVGTWEVEIEAVEDGSIASFTDAGGGQVTVTSTGHPLSNGDKVVIYSSIHYNGTFTISNCAVNTYEITAAYVVDDGIGYWEKVNTFKWSNNLWASETDNVEITGAAQTLVDGVTVTFASTIGHNTGDSWTFEVLLEDTFKWKHNDDSYTSGVKINPSFDITSFADASGGQVRVTTNGVHSSLTGDEMTISGTTNYNGVFTIAVVDTTNFDITSTWVSNDATGTAIRTKKHLSQNVLISFTGSKDHVSGDIWTIASKMDNIKWNENNGSWTTGVCITKSTQTMSKGVTFIFADNDNHTLGDSWTITIEGDITIDRSVTNENLKYLVSPNEYTVDNFLCEYVTYNLRTGEMTITGYMSDGSTYTVSSAAELMPTIGAVITSEQSDLSTDLTAQNPGLPDDPVFY